MTDLVKKHNNIHSYLLAEDQLDPKAKEKEFENLVGIFLKTDDFYGPDVYSPNTNEVPAKLATDWNIVNLLKGERSEGADYYTESLGGTAVEVKYQHDESSIKLHKLAVKEVALNKTNIKYRVLATNLSRVSSTIEDYLPHWTYIFGEDIYNEEVYQRIRQYVLNPKKKIIYTEVGYRADQNGDTSFHEQSIRDMFDEIVAQIGYDGVARLISIKPTASGKGSDPILLWKFFLEKFIEKKSKLTLKVNPSLTVLKGNLIKETKDIKARGSNTQVLVLASDVSKGIEDAEELNLIKQHAEVVNGNTIIDHIVDWMEGSYHLHIETTIHSYHTLGKIMIDNDIVGDFMYIDEVKHTVQDETSMFAQCLYDTYGKWTIRVGVDANLVSGTDEKGNQVPTSMFNKNLWRNFTQPGKNFPVVWEEGDVTSRGWKRDTHLDIHTYDVNELPVEIQGAIHDKKSAIITINGVSAPQEWLFSLDTLARYMLGYPTRKYSLLNLNNRERVARFIEFAKYAWPEIIKQYGDARNPAIRRLLNIPFIDIYSNGNTHNKIQRLVDGIPSNNPKGAIVCQVKKLSEGWDPEDGWVDSVSFVDNSGSKIRIAQTIGRGQRLGGGFDEVVVFQSMVVDPTDQYEVKRSFKLVNDVAETLGLGNNIEDNITFFDHTNPSAPNGSRTKGTRYQRPVWELEGGLMMAFKGFLQNGNFNPYRSVVEEIFHTHSQEILDNIKPGQAKVQKEIYEGVIDQYPDFFNQFKGYEGKRSTLTKILQGKHWLLDSKLKIAGRRQWRAYLQKHKRGYLQDMIDLLNAARATVGKNSIETFLDDKGKFICWNTALYDEFEKITGLNLNGKKEKTRYRNFVNGNGPCKNKYPWRNRIIANAIENIFQKELAISDTKEQEQLAVLEKHLSKVVIFSANSIGWAVARAVEETSVVQHRMNKAVAQFKKNFEVWETANKELAIELYRDNWKNYNTISECDDFVLKTLESRGYLTGKFQLVELIRKKLPEWKTMEKEIRFKAARVVADTRKDYVNPYAKTIVTPKGEFESRAKAAEAYGIVPGKIEKLQKFRGEDFYWKEEGPGKTKMVEVYIVPDFEGGKRTALKFLQDKGCPIAKSYTVSSDNEWWRKVSKEQPKKYRKEQRKYGWEIVG